MWPNNNPFGSNGQFPNSLTQEDFNFSGMAPFGNGPTTPQSQPGFANMPQALFPQDNPTTYEKSNGEDFTDNLQPDLKLIQSRSISPESIH
jgi:hypothetical protein